MIPRTPKAFIHTAKYTDFIDNLQTSQSQAYLDFVVTVHKKFKPNGYAPVYPSNVYGEELINDIWSKYRYYEVCDVDLFWQCMIDTFAEHVHYYNDLLTQYLKDKDIEDLFIKEHSRHDETSRWGSESGSASMSDSEEGTTSGIVETSKEGNELSSVSGTESVTSSGTNTVEKSGTSNASERDTSDTNTDRTVREFDLPNYTVSSSSEDGYLTSKTKEGTSTTNESEKDTSESHEDIETGTSSNTTSKQDASTTERNSGESVTGTTSGTSSSTSSGTTSTSGESSGGSDYDMNTRTTDPKDFYKVKKEILDMIRNIMHEFADKFEDCFLHVF